MSAVKIEYLKWLMWLAEDISRRINKIHMEYQLEAELDDEPSDDEPDYTIHRRHMLRKYQEKPCLCDIHKYQLMRLKWRQPVGNSEEWKLWLAKVLITVLQAMCKAIIKLIEWTQVDCPIHYPAYLTPGLTHKP